MLALDECACRGIETEYESSSGVTREDADGLGSEGRATSAIGAARATALVRYAGVEKASDAGDGVSETGVSQTV